MKHEDIMYIITLLDSLEKSNLSIGIKSHFSIYLEITYSYLVNVFYNYNSCMSQIFLFYFLRIYYSDHQLKFILYRLQML